MARNLLDGEGLRFTYYAGLSGAWANRPPLYGLFVAGVEFVCGPAPEALLFAQSALGALTAVLVARLAFERGGRLAGLAAGVIAALYPYYVGNDTTIVEQPLFACLLAAFALVFARPGAGFGRALASGVIGGLAALTRETFVPFFGLALAAAFSRPAAPRTSVAPFRVVRRVRRGVPARVVAVAREERPALRDPGLLVLERQGAVGREQPGHLREVPPREHRLQRVGGVGTPERGPAPMAHRRARTRGNSRCGTGRWQWSYIRADPARFVRGGLRKVWALLTPALTPRSPSALKRLSYGVSYVPVVMLALIGAVFGGRRFRGLALLAGLMLLALSMTAFVFWGQTRIRSPADVLLITLREGASRRWQPVGKGGPGELCGFTPSGC